MFRKYNPKEKLIQELRKSQKLFSKLAQTLNNSSAESKIVKKSIEDISQLINYINKLTNKELIALLNEENYKSSPVKVFISYSNKDKALAQKMINSLEKFIDKSTILYNQDKGIDATYLDAIKIKNYFSIKSIEITNLKDKKEIYFVGENGDGKTILLQAIVLALKKEYSGQIIEYIRDEKEMELWVKDESSDEYSNHKNIKNVFAYGINRNKVREKFDEYGYSGLFDTSDFKDTTFLKNPLEFFRSENKLVENFIEKLNNYILINDLKVEKDKNGKISFKENEFTMDFETLSEGYKSTIIWLSDLVSRLIENQKEVKKLQDFKAIVLIDEIDLYLHPKWKYNFVYTLREVFPNIQFIMITHSVVTLLGASKEAVFYKIYKEDGETKISNQIPNRGYTNNTLISSPLFNLDTMTSRHYDKRKLSEDDYIYEKIHEVVSKKIKEDINLDEEAILKLIEEEFAKHEKS